MIYARATMDILTLYIKVKNSNIHNMHEMLQTSQYTWYHKNMQLLFGNIYGTQFLLVSFFL